MCVWATARANSYLSFPRISNRGKRTTTQLMKRYILYHPWRPSTTKLFAYLSKQSNLPSISSLKCIRKTSNLRRSFKICSTRLRARRTIRPRTALTLDTLETARLSHPYCHSTISKLAKIKRSWCCGTKTANSSNGRGCEVPDKRVAIRTARIPPRKSISTTSSWIR